MTAVDLAISGVPRALDREVLFNARRYPPGMNRPSNFEVAQQANGLGPAEPDGRVELKLGWLGPCGCPDLRADLAHDGNGRMLEDHGVLVQRCALSAAARIPAGIELVPLQIPADVVLPQGAPFHAILAGRPCGKELATGRKGNEPSVRRTPCAPDPGTDHPVDASMLVQASTWSSLLPGCETMSLDLAEILEWTGNAPTFTATDKALARAEFSTRRSKPGTFN